MNVILNLKRLHIFLALALLAVVPFKVLAAEVPAKPRAVNLTSFVLRAGEEVSLMISVSGDASSVDRVTAQMRSESGSQPLVNFAMGSQNKIALDTYRVNSTTSPLATGRWVVGSITFYYKEGSSQQFNYGKDFTSNSLEITAMPSPKISNIVISPKAINLGEKFLFSVQVPADMFGIERIDTEMWPESGRTSSNVVSFSMGAQEQAPGYLYNRNIGPLPLAGKWIVGQVIIKNKAGISQVYRYGSEISASVTVASATVATTVNNVSIGTTMPPVEINQFVFTQKYSAGLLNDAFGNSMDMDNDTLVIGAPLDKEVGNQAGAVYVYKRQSSVWVKQIKILPPPGFTLFGDQVVLDKDMIAVTAKSLPWHLDETDIIFIYRRNAQQIWEKLNGINVNINRYGYLNEDRNWAYISNISLSNGRLAVGLPDQDMVKVYTLFPAWVPVSEIQPKGFFSKFGFSVALDGDSLVVSKGGSQSHNSFEAQEVYVYNFKTAWWDQKAVITTGLGAKVALKNGILAIASRNKDLRYTVSVYEANTLTADLTPLFSSTKEIGGASLFIKNNFIVASVQPNHSVAAHWTYFSGKEKEPWPQEGLAVFNKTTNGWGLINELTPNDYVSQGGAYVTVRRTNGFGESVAMNDNQIMVGAPIGNFVDNSYIGSAYLFSSEVSKALLGDANLTGTRTTTDITFMRRHILGIEKLVGQGFINAAAISNNPNEITFEDYYKTLHCILGNLSEPFCNVNTTTIPGDANLDGRVSGADIVLMRRHILGLEKLKDMAFVNAAAPANSANEITEDDINKIRECIVGNMSEALCKINTTWTPPNQAPVVTPISNQTLEVGQSKAVFVLATDPENDSLTYSLSSQPANARFSMKGNVIYMAPNVQDVGMHTLTVTVTDSKGAKTSSAFILVVNPQPKTTIQGVVFNLSDSGKPLNGAQVSLIHFTTKQVIQKVVTGVDGQYMFKDVAAGQYSVEVFKQDYSLASRPVMNIVAGVKTLSQNYSLMAFVCVGSVPPNAQLCPGDDKGLTVNMRSNVVSKCSSEVKCEAECKPGYVKNQNSCILKR